MLRRINAYDQKLIRVKEQLLTMSDITGRQLKEAVDSFIQLDDSAAQRVIAGDEVIDSLDETLEMESLLLLSIQQPTDYDLRFLAAAMRISRELERIGDYACDIAEATLQLGEKTPDYQPLVDLPRLCRMVQQMMKKSLQAYLEKDLQSARQMDDDDNEVDRLFLSILDKLTEYMKKGPEYVDQASSILLVTRYLERVGDHVVNISEMNIFTETGIRHPFKQKVIEG